VKINYPMLWDGHPARSLSLAGKMPAPQNILGYFFNWKSLKNCLHSRNRWNEKKDIGFGVGIGYFFMYN